MNDPLIDPNFELTNIVGRKSGTAYPPGYRRRRLPWIALILSLVVLGSIAAIFAQYL